MPRVTFVRCLAYWPQTVASTQISVDSLVSSRDVDSSAITIPKHFIIRVVLVLLAQLVYLNHRFFLLEHGLDGLAVQGALTAATQSLTVLRFVVRLAILLVRLLALLLIAALIVALAVY